MKEAYLIFYNLVQFCGWAAVFATGRLDILMWFQTIQLLEVVHCMVGFVKSSAIQTFMQILSRIIIVWVALVPFPETRETIGYNMILWAWPIAETTRYIYYAISLMKLNIYLATWCRYTLFIGLYPLGVSGELLILTKLVQLFQRSGAYDFPLPNKYNISFYPDLAIIIIMLTYIPRTFKRSNHLCIMKEEDIIYLASAGYDHTIRFWSPHEGKCSRVIQHPQSQVNDLKITPDKTFLAAAGFQHVRMYNILTAHNNNPEINLEGFNNNVLSIGFQEDSKWLFSGGEDCVTRVWDLRTRKNQSQRMYESESAVNSVKLHSNQVELFIGQQYGHINIWDIRYSNATPMVRLTQQHPSNYTGVQCLSLNPIEDILAAIDNKGYVHIFSPAQTLTLYCSWKAHSRYGIKCLFSPNGKYLVTTSADHSAKVWKTCDILKFKSTCDEQQQLQDSGTVSATDNVGEISELIAQVSLTSTSAPSPLATLPTKTLMPCKVLTSETQRWVWDVAFSADSKFLVTASSDSIVRLWHVESAEVRREYTGHQKAVTALAFSD